MKEIELVMFNLSQIEEDSSIPKSVRAKVKCAIHALQEENGKSIEVKIDKALQELDELSDDPNIQSFTRSQIWEIVSSLSSQIK
jgi:uncharacterized protein (UPF0147 family)